MKQQTQETGTRWQAARRFIAVLCSLLVAAPPALPSDQTKDGIKITGPTMGGGPFGGFLHEYQGHHVAPVNMSDSPRLDQLIRGGIIYLSLQDAIALAIENNLDIQVQRYDPLIADADLLRAQSGGLLRGVPQGVQNGIGSAGQGVSGGALGQATTTSVSAAATTPAANVNGIISQLGPTTPNLDPVLTGFTGFSHSTTPETSNFLTGTSALISKTYLANFTLTQGFLTGTTAALSFDNRYLNQNATTNTINPSWNATLDLTVSQQLLQGFGLAVNNRNIRISENEQKTSDLTFQEQLIATISNIVGLYWDLVSYNENVRYARQNLALSQQTYSDNKKQVEIGTLAPIEITRAEAEVAAREQDVTVAETNELQQETIIKNALSKNGVASPEVAAARVVPIDKIQVPEKDNLPPLADLEATALKTRPELEQSRLNLDNNKIQLEGLHNALLPTLTAVGELTNIGQSGQVYAPGVRKLGPPDPYFVGGYTTALAQAFRRNFPDYNIGAQWNVIFRNRSAQADYIYNQLTLRQAELSTQKQKNQVLVDVQNAMIGVQQARSRYLAAVKQRILEQQTLDAEQKKYKLGASTLILVIQTQRDLALAESNEVTAASAYQKAVVSLQVATGQVLSSYKVDIGDARNGVVRKGPSPLPANLPKPQ
jgi:outer membrane protein